MDKKTELRIRAKAIRKNLNILRISERLAGLVRQNSFYVEAKNILLFYPTKYEINLLSLLEDGKNFYFPRVEGANLQVCPYCSGDELKKSEFNILEPCSNPVSADVLDLVIVPALMVDKKGYRLGYGGGFYDRFLAQIGSGVKTICAIPEELVIDELPREDFDIALDVIISD